MREQLIDLVDIIPIEFVVRNIVTGSLTKVGYRRWNKTK